MLYKLYIMKIYIIVNLKSSTLISLKLIEFIEIIGQNRFDQIQT
jgi:hypothetical protein